MKQSNIIFFFLFAGFVVFITLRGELPKYLAVLGIGEGSAASQAAGATLGTASSGTASTVGAVAGAVGAVAGAVSGNYGGAIASAIGSGTSPGWDNNTSSGSTGAALDDLTQSTSSVTDDGIGDASLSGIF